ncbi:MAG TPA: flagellar basal body rod C-terminal domain-containing protein [Gemmatimonadales bacterium]|nr:flagellar basal body rod C-terminal domain-containing protein [Gemmatimonadales bacterium]
MFSSLFGPGTRIGDLRWSLDDSSHTQKAIGQRVASALGASGSTDFSQALAKAQAAHQPVDLEKEMVNLASTELRYETSAKLLTSAYQDLRTAVSSNGNG